MKTYFKRLRRLAGAAAVCAALQGSALLAVPTVSILAPFGGSSYLPGTSLPVQIQATDPDGLISQIDLTMNGELVATTTPLTSSASFSIYVELPSIGTYILEATATSTTTLQATSGQVVLTAAPYDETIPRAYIDHPLPLGGGDTVNDVSVASSMFINAVVTDGDGSISEVRFYINGQDIGPATGQIGDVYSIFFNPDAPGSYSIVVEALDNDGKSGFSVPLPLDVGPLERPLPVGEVYVPFENGTTGQTMAIYATADGGLIPIDRVDFFADGVLIGSTDAPLGAEENVYGITWTPDAPGDYTLNARIVQIDPADATYDNWRITNLDNPLTVSVTDPAPGEVPSIAIVDPLDRSEQTVLNPIAIQVEADNPLGTIDFVRFYENGELVKDLEGQEIPPDTTYPYTVSFQPPSPGLYRLVAEMVTNTGQRIQSGVVSVRVNTSQLPTVEITSPADGAGVSVGSPVILTASATSTGGSELELKFYANGVLFGEDDTYPYGQSWTSQSVGTFALKVEAYEPGTAGVAASDEIFVTVNPTQVPTAEIVEPSGPNPSVGSDVLIEVEAGDADGYVTEVEFFVNGFPLPGRPSNPDMEEPFTNFWTPGSEGIYTLSALVTDNSGNQFLTSKEVTVVQPVGIVPRVTLSVTGSGNITPGSRVMVRANAFDDDPENLKVLFFLNGALLAEDLSPPYSVIVDPETLFGTNFYELVAVAFDSDGNSRAYDLSPLYISDVSVDQPSIDIISLEEDENLTLGSRAPIRVEVSGGAVSDIASVVFYADGVEIGRDYPATGFDKTIYTLDWIPDRTGDIQLTAATLLNTRLYDHDGDEDDDDWVIVTPVNISSPVNVSVNPAIGILPSISLDVLPNDRNLTVGSKVLLYADAQDLDGTVDQVEFFVDGSSVGVDAQAPFTHVLTTQKQGDFALNGIATDSSGNVVTSTYVNLQVTARVITLTPEVVLTVPSSGQEGSLLSLRASTEGFVNPPEAVVFYANGQPIGESTERPYSFSWLANLSGEVTFFATARQALFDGTLVTTVSNIETISLTDNVQPVITEVEVMFPNKSPAKPDPLAGEILTFTISVDDSGPIQTVELLRDGEPIALSGSAGSPFEVTDTPPGLGDYVYSVVVTDRGGLQTQSDPIPISVVVGEPPTITVTAPEDGSTVPQNSPVVLRATASDPDGTVAEVTFYVNGLPVGGVLTSVPYQTEYTPPASGSYEVTARARDNSGNLGETASPVTFTVVVDDPPVFLDFSNDLPDSIARIGQVVTWTMDATDDNGLVSVRLYRDGTVIESSVAIPLEQTDVLESLGRFRYYAEATDSAGNVTRSDTIEVNTTRGTPPIVSVTSPLNNTSYDITQSIELAASAQAASEPAGEPAGSIARVEFYLNGALQGTDTNAPYRLAGVSLQEGQNVITAVATSDTGLTTESAEVLVTGVDGSVPEILSFTSDVSGGKALAGTIINFLVTAYDEKGIEQIELLLAGDPVAFAEESPAAFAFVPDSPGTYAFSARVTNVNGLMSESEPIEISVRLPDPLGSNSDFVLQTFLDLLMRNPTPEEQASYTSRLDSGDLTRDRFVRELIDPADGLAESDYDAVRGALLANRILLGQWPSREELETDTGTVRDGSLKALVTTFMITFEEQYKAEVNPDGVPEILSSDSEIADYVSYLWELKFLEPPTPDQLELGTILFKVTGRDGYTADFINDVEIGSIPGTGWYSTKMGFQWDLGSPPDETFLREADAASLLINFLRIIPTDEEVSTLAAKLFAAQVAEVTDPEGPYADRFEGTFTELENFAFGWKESDWFGTFNTSSEPWMFHSVQGWIAFQTTGQSEDNLWYYDRSMGWMWTRDGTYPNVYSDRTHQWLYVVDLPYESEGTRVYYDYSGDAWIMR